MIVGAAAIELVVLPPAARPHDEATFAVVLPRADSPPRDAMIEIMVPGIEVACDLPKEDLSQGPSHQPSFPCQSSIPIPGP